MGGGEELDRRSPGFGGVWRSKAAHLGPLIPVTGFFSGLFQTCLLTPSHMLCSDFGQARDNMKGATSRPHPTDHKSS